MKKSLPLSLVIFFLASKAVFAQIPIEQIPEQTSQQAVEETPSVVSPVVSTPVVSTGKEPTTWQQKREEFRHQVQQKREAIEATIAEKRAAFQQKLQEIKDKRKQAIVERINDRITNFNKNRTDHFANVLQRLLKIMEKLQIRIDKAKEVGKDVSAVQAAIDEAKAAISSAQEQVLAQAGHSYPIEITTETALKETVKPVVEQFKEHLKNTRETVKNARTAVHNAFRQLRTLGGFGPVASPAGQPVVQPTVPSPAASQ